MICSSQRTAPRPMRKHQETRRIFCGKIAAALPGSLFSARLFGGMKRVTDRETERYLIAEKHLFEAYEVHGKSFFIRLPKPPLSVRLFDAGRGEPLVLIHGGGATLAQFAPLIGSLESEFHIYAPDRPGCGLTDKLDYTGVSIRRQAVDFMTSLFDSLKLQRAAVAGCSIGGYWALVFALAAPERVTKLVLLGGPAASASTWPTHFPPPRSEQPPPTLESTRMEYRVLMANGDRASKEMVEASLAAARIPGAALAWDSMVAQAHREFPTPMSYALRPELKNLKPPALFLMGDKDMEGPASLAQQMAAAAPHGRFQFVPGSGHLIWLDQPSAVQRLTREFLNSK